MSPTFPAQDFYTLEEVAGRLKLHIKTVRSYVRDGRLKATRIGKQYRVARTDLEVFSGTTPPEIPRPGCVDVSSVVTIDPISRPQVLRLTDALMAAANSHKGRDSPPLRVETVYDESRAALKVILIGNATTTAHLLELIQLLVET